MRLHSIITRRGTLAHQSLRRSYSSGGADKDLIKHVIITGASGGIGRAIAWRFASEGAQCTLVGRSKSKLQTSLNGLSALNDHRIVVGDVGKEAFWRELATKMVSERKGVLINGADAR